MAAAAITVGDQHLFKRFCQPRLPRGQGALHQAPSPTPLSAKNEISRFLIQASFGPKRADLANVSNITKWIQDQIYVVPMTSPREHFRKRVNVDMLDKTSVQPGKQTVSSGNAGLEGA